MRKIVSKTDVRQMIRYGPKRGGLTLALGETKAFLVAEYVSAGKPVCLKIVTRRQGNDYNKTIDELKPNYEDPATATEQPFRWRWFWHGNNQTRAEVKMRLRALGFRPQILDLVFPRTKAERNALQNQRARDRRAEKWLGL